MARPKDAPRPQVPASQPPSPAATRPARAARGVLIALVLFATGLRLWNLREGLPDFFDEAFPFRRAFEMAGWENGRVEWNPHAFHYPSLTFYVHMTTQWIHYLLGRLLGDYSRPADYFVAFHVDPTAMVMAGRLVGVLAHAAIVLGVVAIGERLRRGAGLLAGLLVALSATLIRDARTIYTDALMAAFAIWALERMLAYRAGAGWRALVACAVLIGFAAGAKYPAVFLVLPLAWAVSSPSRAASPGGREAGPGSAEASRDRRRALVPWALASAGAAVVFLLTSPFLLQSLAEARFDLLRIANQMGGGQLGTFDRPAGLFYLDVLVRDFGLAAPFLLVASAFLAWRGGHTLRPAVGIWLFVLALALPVAVTRVEFERYLVPVEPAVALLVSLAALTLPDLGRASRRTWREAARALLVLLLVAPAAFAGFRAAALGGDTTQSRARRWLEENVQDHELLVQETHGPRLLDRWEAQRVAGGPAFQRADPSWQRRYLQQRVLRAVTIPLLVAGRAVVTAPGPEGTLRQIELFPSSADLNRVFYDPRLFAGVDWVLTSDAVRGRYRADTTRYAAQAAFYRLLDAVGPTATFRSGDGVTGPELRIHRLDESTRAALRARFGPLDPFWWTRDVPAAARAELESTMMQLGAWTDTSQAPPLWIQGLGTLFDQQIQPFAYQTALELAEIGHCREASSLAEAILRMSPGHLQACGIVVTCAPATGDFATARRVLERLLAMRDPQGSGLADIRLEYAQVLSQTGDFISARRELQRVLAASLQRGETARRARALLDRIGSSPTP